MVRGGGPESVMKAPSQEVVGLIPLASSGRKVVHPRRKLKRLFLPILTTLLIHIGRMHFLI